MPTENDEILTFNAPLALTLYLLALEGLAASSSNKFWIRYGGKVVRGGAT
ncbi:MAG: hypothetical protein LBJ13_00625 [Puniceicoccales bacterium]|jgi:hypothetical protein|nr:hypothetical protein [Puniceicoccales bacterium]